MRNLCRVESADVNANSVNALVILHSEQLKTAAEQFKVGCDSNFILVD
jgi:hypothetical protein